MKSLGVNFIRVFEWNVQRQHEAWLDLLANNNIYTAGVFSNTNLATADALNVWRQFDGFSSAAKGQIAAWFVGNELDPNDGYAHQTLAVLKNRERNPLEPLDQIPICMPFQMSSTEDAINKVRMNYEQQFEPLGLENRFLACLNFYGLSEAATVREPKDQLSDFIEGFFADPFIQSKNITLLLTEFGINFDFSSGVDPNAGGDAVLQGTYLNEMLAQSKALQARYPGFLGQAVFQYVNKSWKSSRSEANFGLYSLNTQLPPTGNTTAGSPYPVDDRSPRPQHDAVSKNY
jgi:hypothetical protein